MELFFIFIISLGGSMIQGATGFGFAIFAMPLLSLVFPFKTASVVVAIAILVLCTQLMYRMRGHIDTKLILYPVLSSLVGRTIGVHTLMHTGDTVLKTALGIVLILMSIYIAFYEKKIKIRPTKVNGIIAGTTSGILGGLFNTGGPPLVLYYLFATEDKMKYNGCVQASFAISALYTVVLHGLYGNINIESIKLSIVAVIAITIGSFLGLMIFKRLKSLNKIIYSFMAVMGIMLIIESF